MNQVYSVTYTTLTKILSNQNNIELSWRSNSKVSDLWSRGRGFDSRSGRRYQVVSTWIGDCLRTGKPYNQPPRSTQPSIPSG